MKRIIDIFLSLALLAILMPIMLLISIIVQYTSTGGVLYWSDRVGVYNKIFRMPKFRSMYVDTPEIATHLMSSYHGYLTPVGKFLRRYSLDELPQLFSILMGDMSFVGPRPALFNQNDLISLRSEMGVSKLIPGITGWAQINGRDKISIQDKVLLDVEYMNKMSLYLDIKIMFLTFLIVITGKNISH